VRFAVLGSGSKGNALVVDGGGARVLVDCGYAPREIKRRLESLSLDVRDIDAVLLTHGHGDHMKGAKQFAGSLGIPTYATEETKRFCAGFGGLRNHVPIAAGRAFSVKGLDVIPVGTPHDAPGSVCFVVDDGSERVGVCTDLGMPTQSVADALSTCDSILLEHNHDVEMLEKGPYSPSLKRRILSTRGHLSNVDGAKLLSMALRAGRSLTRVILGHLSEVNNTPKLAMSEARPVVDGRDIELSIAPQHHPTGWLRARLPSRTSTRTASISAPSQSLRPPDDHAPKRFGAEPPQGSAEPKGVALKQIALSRQLALFGSTTTR
jgi:phosphoribosyl 1,2-cyclic phosphodiesterase